MPRPLYLHPLNLTLRFILEFYAFWCLLSYALFAFDGGLRVLLAVLFPLTAACLWGIFRVPNDGGKTVVKVHGKVRLLIEFLVFASAVLAMAGKGNENTALIFALVVAGHYLFSCQRVIILWHNRLLTPIKQ